MWLLAAVGSLLEQENSLSLEPGRQVAHYRIVEKIGEGGMGVVWKAVDTTLDREVALKILPEAFAADAMRLSRFEREAKLLASLNHPNIAVVHGLHEEAGIRFLAMELCPGEDLAQRLRRGPLPVDEAVGVASKLVDALAAAHASGVVHRDLKPANIQIAPGGGIKVLDFGLAKAMVPEPQASDARSSLSPTVTSAGTVAGLILGTAAYMSPEQARGGAVDERTDTWAFGCVLFEMLTGKQAFAGPSVSDSIASILRAEPDWDALPAATPRPVRRLLRRCLAKDADRRLHSAADARLDLDEAEGLPGVDGEGPVTRRPAVMVAMVVAGLAAGLATGLLVPRFMSSTAVAPRSAPVHLEMTLPESSALAAGNFLRSLALSPEGDRLVYVGVDQGIRRLYVRDMQDPEVTLLPGTEGAEGPFFSPDGRWIGFFADWKLKRIPITGGSLPRQICELTDFRGAAWGADDIIVLAPSQLGPLHQVSANGGEPEPLTEITDEAFTHRMPDFLPDGRTVLFSAYASTYGFNFEDSTLWVHSMETGQSKRLMDGGAQPRYAPSGHILYYQAGSLLAVPFDTEALEVTGTPRRVLQDVAVQVNTGAAQFDVSRSGTLVYVPGGMLGDDIRLALLDRQGEAVVTQDLGGIGRYPRLGPDGRHFMIFQIGARRHGLWRGEIGVSGQTLLAPNGPAAWSSDGERIVYTQGLPSVGAQLFVKDADGGGSATPLTPEQVISGDPSDFSPDDKVVAYAVRSSETGFDLWTVALDGSEPQVFLAEPANEEGIHFSPDGSHVVYASDANGRYEIYVTTFPEREGTWQISIDGGREPFWSADGSEIYFRSGDNIMVVPVQLEGGFRHEAPGLLFRGFYDGQLGTAGLPNYDVSNDGQRFLMTRSVELNLKATRVQVILNWAPDLAE